MPTKIMQKDSELKIIALSSIPSAKTASDFL